MLCKKLYIAKIILIASYNNSYVYVEQND